MLRVQQRPARCRMLRCHRQHRPAPCRPAAHHDRASAGGSCTTRPSSSASSCSTCARHGGGKPGLPGESPTGQLGAQRGMAGNLSTSTDDADYADHSLREKSTSIRFMARTSASLSVMPPAAGQNASAESMAVTNVVCKSGGALEAGQPAEEGVQAPANAALGQHSPAGPPASIQYRQRSLHGVHSRGGIVY